MCCHLKLWLKYCVYDTQFPITHTHTHCETNVCQINLQLFCTLEKRLHFADSQPKFDYETLPHSLNILWVAFVKHVSATYWCCISTSSHCTAVRYVVCIYILYMRLHVRFDQAARQAGRETHKFSHLSICNRKRAKVI